MHLVTFVEIILILLALPPTTRSGIELIAETAQEAAGAFALLLALLPFILVLLDATAKALQGIHSCCSLVGDGDIEGRRHGSSWFDVARSGEGRSSDVKRHFRICPS